MFGAHCTVRRPEHYTQGLSGHEDHGSLPRPRKSLIRNAPTLDQGMKLDPETL